MRHNPSTVVVLAGHPGAGLLSVIGRLMNVVVVRPGDNEDAASTLRRAAGISSPYVLVAAEWQSMWQITDAPRGTEAFELRAGEVLASWRAGQLELPDYYLVLAEQSPPRPDFYLGPLRALRPHRVAVVTASETSEQATGVLTALGSLRHGRWWPPLPEVIDSARGFYPGSLAETPEGASVPLLG
ncbi:MAG TPA: hypothetical protein VMG38_05510 [Trebonia sp.]|nr:hypothetical protein [Trebonia sp.]